MAGIYIHIPFCRQACHYCDFHFSTSLKSKESLIDAICKELTLRKGYLSGEVINTIYFGGGTPSILEREELEKIFRAIESNFAITENPEITLEANPDDLTPNKLKELKSLSINRFSIGIQSFFDKDLKYMNRAHNANEAYESVLRAQGAGFSNISIDLIYGTPTMNHEEWQANLEKAFSLDVPHISSYCLTVEDGTALSSFIKKGTSKGVNEDLAAEQLEILMLQMEANGYEQYEISNFAKDKAYSKHNTNYWRNEKYLGIGPSAHSFDGSSRQWNISNNNTYIKSLGNSIIAAEREELNQIQRLNEYIMTSLRTVWGLDLEKVEKEFNSTFVSAIKISANDFVNEGSLLKENNTLKLSKKGKLIADRIAARLFVE